MLSGETAVGDYPVEAVQKMESILRSYEPDRSIMFRIRQTFQQFVLLLKKAWTWLVNRGNTTTLSPL
jgi:pyruvate kinase